ncbi:hypothetical protein C0Q89_15020, partial [Lacticaseibacillus rhamnosus]
FVAVTTNVLKTVWFKGATSGPHYSKITLIQGNEAGNQSRLSLDDPLSPSATLKDVNLPTLLQSTASDSNSLPYDADDIKTLAALTKALTHGGYQFATIDATILQPINGLHFKTRFDNLTPTDPKKTVVKPG